MTTSNLPPGARSSQQPRQGSTQTRTAEEAFMRMWEILRDDDLSELDNVCTDDFRLTMPGSANVTLSDTKEIAQAWRTAFSDFGQRRGNLTTIMSQDGQQAAIRDSHTLTHTGDFQLPNGQTIEASRNEVVIYGAYFILTDEDGRIKKLDIYFNTDDLASQMRGDNPQQDQEYRSYGTMDTTIGSKGDQTGPVRLTTQSGQGQVQNSERTQRTQQ